MRKNKSQRKVWSLIIATSPFFLSSKFESSSVQSCQASIQFSSKELFLFPPLSCLRTELTVKNDHVKKVPIRERCHLIIFTPFQETTSFCIQFKNQLSFQRPNDNFFVNQFQFSEFSLSKRRIQRRKKRGSGRRSPTTCILNFLFALSNSKIVCRTFSSPSWISSFMEIDLLVER